MIFKIQPKIVCVSCGGEIEIEAHDVDRVFDGPVVVIIRVNPCQKCTDAAVAAAVAAVTEGSD